MSRLNRGQRPNFAPALALGAFALVLGGVATWTSLLLSWDTAGLRAIALRAGQSPGWLIESFQWITWAGDAAQRSIVMIGFALVLLSKKRWRAALIMLIFPAVAGASSSILKQLFARSRPDIVPHLDSFSNLSFPSGHATSATAILILAALIVPTRQRGLWLALAGGGAALVASSRLLLGVHWPSDIVGGMAWGLGFALAGQAMARAWGDAPR